MHIGTTAALLSFFLAATGAGVLARQADPMLAGSPTLPPELRRELEQRFAAAYDEANAGWTRGEKLLDADAVELSLVRAHQGDETARDRARATLDAATNLIDPASGGIARSSSASNWRAPVPDRTLAAQADALRAYALAFALWRFPQDEQIARGVVRYLDRSLASPAGAFHAGRGAARRVQARDNGAAIEGLAALADATGDLEALARARRAARDVLAHRGAPGGGFRSGEAPGPAALADTLAMGAAFLALYGATAEPEWLERARDAAQALEELPGGTVAESAGIVRFANLLSHWTGEEQHRALAFRALRLLLAGPRELAGPPQPAVLLAADELARPPLHITVAGRFDDPAARALYAAARRTPNRYKRTDLWDRAAGPLRNTAVQFPPVRAAAAFICSQTSCSLPITNPEDLARAADRAARTMSAQTP
jgi:uncharacterized protein YyaL (SSP411 family)